MTYPPEPPEKVELIGSGTFISLGSSLYGILTAYHVLKDLDQPCDLGLVLVEEEHSSRIPVTDLDLVEIAVPPYPGASPDLAFIGLPLNRAKGISDFKSFYDLAIDREEMTTNPPDRKSAVWFVNGTPKELTKNVPSEGAYKEVQWFHSLCGAGGVELPTFEREFDYLESIVEYEEEYALPSTFLGISGGGLWQVTFKTGPGEFIPDRYLLAGMAFAETEEIIEGKRKILCHGPKSIYEYAYTFLEDWNSTS